MYSSNDPIFDLISRLSKTQPIYSCSLSIDTDKEITGIDLKNIWKYQCSLSKEFNDEYTDQFKILQLLEDNQQDMLTETKSILDRKIDTTYTEDEKYIIIYNNEPQFNNLFTSHITSPQSHLIIYIINNKEGKSKLLLQLHSDSLWIDLYKESLKSNNPFESYSIFNKSPFRIFEGDLNDFNLTIPNNLKDSKVIALCFTLV
jgi:hypothetical protein